MTNREQLACNSPGASLSLHGHLIQARACSIIFLSSLMRGMRCLDIMSLRERASYIYNLSDGDVERGTHYIVRAIGNRCTIE